jgi:hypothetical protein
MEDSRRKTTVTNRDQVVIDLLAALSDAWLRHSSPDAIANDPDKIRLLNDARNSVDPSKVQVPDDVRELYEGVFLRDVWAD